ncbi:MAG: cell division protein FtsQ/DivIB [Candidatus Omnitrophota bacterium]|jgi:hypothetical protein
MKKSPKFQGLVFKYLVSAGMIFLALYALGVYSLRWIRNCDYFLVKDVIVNANKPENVSFLKGRNIFVLDLKKIARHVSELYPVYKKIRIIRILPNQLFVDLQERIALAAVKLGRYYYVDRELSLWDADFLPQDPDLPIIVGLENRLSFPHVGSQYHIPQLAFALDIIQATRGDRVLKSYRIARIDIKKPEMISFFIPIASRPSNPQSENELTMQDLEVRINSGKVDEKISILSGLFTQFNNDLATIQYIDMRFKEPVIRFKDK